MLRIATSLQWAPFAYRSEKDEAVGIDISLIDAAQLRRQGRSVLGLLMAPRDRSAACRAETPALRTLPDGEPFRTDGGNLIADCRAPADLFADPAQLDERQAVRHALGHAGGHGAGEAGIF